VTSGGTNWAADDISSVFYARNKIVHGADGVNDGDVSTANPFPIRLYVGTTTCNLSTGLAVGALRVVSASNCPAVTALEVIDNLVLLEDAAHASADPGVQVLAVRKATPVNLSGTDGDYEPLQISAGRLWASATIDAALPAGTNAIGKLASNSGVTVGAVEIAAAQTLATVTTVTTVTAIGTSVTPGTSAAHLGKAVDGAAGGTDTGVAALVVRDDALTTLTPADGDYTTFRVNSTGALWVDLGGLAVYTTDVAAPASPVGLSGLAIRDDALSSLTPAEGDWVPRRVNARGADWVVHESMHVDDAAFTLGTHYVTAVGFAADETSTDSVDEGDIGLARMTLDRKQHVVAENFSDSVRQNSTARTPVFAVIDAATSGDNTIVAALGASTKIRVLQVCLVAAGSLTARFESGASGTALTGQMSLIAGTPLVTPYCPLGLFETAANTLLNLELSAATSVDGWIVYIPAT
jgi:hypothetical protein